MITKKYVTKSNVELEKAVFVITSINRNTNTHESEHLSQERGVVRGSNSNTHVDMTVHVFKDLESFNDLNVKEIEEYTMQDSMNLHFSPDIVEGETLRDKGYNYLLSLPDLAGALIVEGEAV